MDWNDVDKESDALERLLRGPREQMRADGDMKVSEIKLQI